MGISHRCKPPCDSERIKMFSESTNHFFVVMQPSHRTDDGRDEAESGAGERAVGSGGEKADGIGKAAGCG